MSGVTIDLCVITSHYDNHAKLVVEALQAGNYVFVEKPLAIYEDELTTVIAAKEAADQFGKRMVVVCFNRRFSPTAQQAKALLDAETSGN